MSSSDQNDPLNSTPRLIGPDERPSLGVAGANALQHVGMLLAINVAFPLLLLDALAERAPEADRFVGLCFVMLGAATLIQTAKTRYLGSGLFVPATFTAAYIPGLILAAERGGVPLMAGMLLVGAATEITVGLLVWRIRHFLTVELAGVVVLSIGLLLAIVGFRLMVAINEDGTRFAEAAAQPALGIVVLMGMALWAVYAKGRAASLAALFGLVLGAALTPIFGALGPHELDEIGNLSLFDVPMPFFPVPEFDVTLVPEFMIAGLACAFRAVGDIVTAERASFVDWRRPDYRSVTRGVLADGLSTALSAVIGTLGLSTFSGSVGIAAAAKIMSRFVAQLTGVILILVGLSPVMRSIARAIPSEVSGAILVFSAIFIISNGILVIGSRTLDNRRILVIGAAIIAGTVHTAFPHFFADLPDPWNAFARSNLSATVLIAVTLTLLFSLGAARRSQSTIDHADLTKAREFIQVSCARGGVATDVAEKILASIEEIITASEELEGTKASGLSLALSVTSERVTLTAEGAHLLRLAKSWEERQAPPPASLDEVDDIAGFLDHVRLRLLIAQGSDVTIRAAETTGRVRIVFDQ
ncbi:MAG: solute carrier family 23 protein [Pseudomonadota bacterium]